MYGFVVSFIVSEDFRITRKELGKCADARKYDPVFFSDRTKFRDLGKMEAYIMIRLPGDTEKRRTAVLQTGGSAGS